MKVHGINYVDQVLLILEELIISYIDPDNKTNYILKYGDLVDSAIIFSNIINQNMIQMKFII